MIHRTSRAIVLCIACVALAIGIAGRIDGLDHKLFWQDESFSMLRITGHDEAQLYAAFDGGVHPASDLLALDRLDAHSSLGATVVSLGEEPQRGPLFYILAAAWARALGDGIVAMRVLPMLLGLVGIGLAFGLGRRMGGGLLGGAFLASLVALSPIELHFSQQLREYVLIADAILGSAWALLAAIDRPTTARWIAYAIAAAIGLYASPLFLAALLSHIAVAIVASRRPGSSARATLQPFCISIVAALAAYAPWALRGIAASGAHSGDLAWLHGGYPLRSFALKWAFNVGAVFFDSEFAQPSVAFLVPPILLLAAIGFAIAFRRAEDRLPRTLALATPLCCAIPIVAIDLATHAHFEAVTRYQMGTWIGIDLLVTVALAKFVRSPAPSVRAVTVVAFAFLAGCGAYSAFVDRAYAVFWDDNEHLDERLVARTIALGHAPAIVLASKSNGAAPYALVLSHYLPPRTSLLLYDDAVPALPSSDGDLYLFVPSRAVVDDVRRRLAASGSMLENVSPAFGLTIPDLRSARDARDAEAIGASNALWMRVRYAKARNARAGNVAT